MRFAKRMGRLGTETAFEVLATAKRLEAEGKSVIHLEIGEPDFDTAENIVEAAVLALRSGAHHYTPAPGIPELRQAIAREVSRSRNIDVSPEEVVVTPGGKPIIFYSLLALVEPQEEVIYTDPAFPIYESMVNFVGAKSVRIPLREDLDFRLDVQELLDAVSPKTRLIILNSPNNPTGSVLTGEDLKALSEALVDSPVTILSDEIYSRIIYEGEHRSIASFAGMKEKTILLDGFSKTYAMTGWRLGYGVMNAKLAEQFARLMINSNSCTATFTQLAGVAAIKGDQSSVEGMKETFRKRRDVLLERLNAIEGVSCRRPGGAFYAFPNIRDTGHSSAELANALLNECGVAVLAGTAFGRNGEGYLRISYANSLEALEEGLRRSSDRILRGAVKLKAR